jgi:hypothetical protein
VNFDRLATLIVLAIAALLPFEDFLLKWLPVSGMTYSVLRLWHEAVLYLLLGSLALRSLAVRRPWRRTVLDLPIGLFLGFALAASLSGGGDWLTASITVRTVLRYPLVWILVAQLDTGTRELRRLQSIVVGVAVIQVGIGLTQLWAGEISAVWLPRETSLAIGGYQKEFQILTNGVEQGAIVGAFGHTVAMALFLFVAASLLSGRIRAATISPLIGYPLLGVLLFGSILTYSRLVTMLTGLAILWASWYTRSGLKWASRGIVLAGALLVLLVGSIPQTSGLGLQRVKEDRVSPLENFQMLLDVDFWEVRVSGSRLWVIREVGSALLGPQNWIGMGGDPENARETLAGRERGSLTKVLWYGPLEDVYWVALLLYFGIGGAATFFFMCSRIVALGLLSVRRHPSGRGTLVGSGYAMIVLGVGAITLGFAVRAPEFRTFGYYLWLFPALLSNALARLEKTGHEGVEPVGLPVDSDLSARVAGTPVC